MELSGHECADYTALVSRRVTAREREVVTAGLPVVSRNRFIVGLLAMIVSALVALLYFFVLTALPPFSFLPVVLNGVIAAFIVVITVALSGRLVRVGESGVEAWREHGRKRTAPPPGTLFIGATPLPRRQRGEMIAVQMRTARLRR